MKNLTEAYKILADNGINSFDYYQESCRNYKLDNYDSFVAYHNGKKAHEWYDQRDQSFLEKVVETFGQV